MVPDRVQLNTPATWAGPKFALGLVDEIVASNVTAHLEMQSDNAAYLGLYRDGRQLTARIYARPTTRGERRQILDHRDDRLYDHLASLIPHRWGGRSLWSIPVWRRPAACLRDWWWARRAAGAVVEVRIDHDELIAEEP